MWIVVIQRKTEWIAHSVHKEESEARAWARCLAFSGKDETSVVKVDSDVLDEINAKVT